MEFTAKWGAQYPAIIRLWENAWTQISAARRTKPALNAFAITFNGRITPTGN